jgi:predicted small integral membrane protein
MPFSLAVSCFFAATCAASVLLYVLSAVRPQVLASNISIPHVFQLERNLGASSFDFQTVIYAVFHRSLLDDVCHHFLTLDQVAWAMLAYALAGTPGLAVLGALAVLQATTFGDRGLVALLGAAWTVFCLAAVGLTHLLGMDAVWVAQATLIASAMLRMLGHAAEPLPPLVGHDSLEFVPVRLHPRLVLTGAAGYVAEFASGIPFRLFPAQLRLMAQRFGYAPAGLLSLEAISELAARLGRDGWGAWPTTRALYASHPSLRVQPD